MKLAVTIINPLGYLHSRAFQEVAESVHHASIALGHDSIITGETNCLGRQHIVLGSNLLPYCRQELAPGTILYNLEQVSPDSLWLTPDLTALLRGYPLWDYSRQNIERLNRMGIQGVVHVPLGYMPQLTRIPAAEEDIDVLFIGSMNERRLAVIEALRARGIGAEWRSGVYGVERDRLIARAKIVLNVHYYTAKIFEAVRVSYLLANKRFVISERSSDAEEDAAFADGVVFAAYDELVDACVQYLSRPARRAEVALAGFALMRERPQTAILEPVLRRLQLQSSPAAARVAGHCEGTEASHQDVGAASIDRVGEPANAVKEGVPRFGEIVHASGAQQREVGMKNGQTICLNMIVKNEAQVIRRCLESVRPLIDYWVIADTGSSDDTKEIIRDTLKDIPGELHEHPWVNFGYNRTQALTQALGSPTEGRPPKCDYTFLLDADHVVGFADGFELPRLDADSYDIELRYGGVVYFSKRLVRSDLAWRYVGVLHEYITCDDARTEAVLQGLWQVPIHDGARARDPLTYRRDALLLEQGLLDEPENARYVFYLAQTYRDAGDPELALRNYRRRIGMGGWLEEVWFSLYQIARIKEDMGKSWEEVLQDYLIAYQAGTDRAEPLYHIGMHYQGRREFHLAHIFLGHAMRLGHPQGNRLFVERPLYDYLIALEYAVCCYWAGYHADAIAVNDRLLSQGLLPPHLRDRVQQNRQFSVDVIGSKTPS